MIIDLPVTGKEFRQIMLMLIMACLLLPFTPFVSGDGALVMFILGVLGIIIGYPIILVIMWENDELPQIEFKMRLKDD